MAGTLGTGTLHFTVSQPLIRRIILRRSLSRTSCQSNLELRREKHTGGRGGGLQTTWWEAAGRHLVMDEGMGDGLGEAIHLHARGAPMVREGVVVDPELAWDEARSEGLVSIYLDSGR